MVPVDRLEKYWDFVAPERSGEKFDPKYIYDPRAALQKLLTCLTPDTKALALAGMGEAVHFTKSQLTGQVNKWLSEAGASESIPVTSQSMWHYLNRRDTTTGLYVDGSLIDIGAVVKETHLLTSSGYMIGYQRSSAGKELVVPLVQRAVDFVFQAESFIPMDTTDRPRYVSMNRVLGNIGSTTDKRPQLLIFDIVKFLVEHEGKYRQTDLLQDPAFRNYSAIDLRNGLTHLDMVGVLKYQSATKEQQGKRPKGWSIYEAVDPASLEKIDISQVYQLIRSGPKRFFEKGLLQAVLEYIKRNPDQAFNSESLSLTLNKHTTGASRILNALESVGILKVQDDGFQGHVRQSSAESNKITHLFYSTVLEPASKIAESLLPLPLRSFDPDRLNVFIERYTSERNRKGPGTGDEARNLALSILAGGEEIKLSDLLQRFNTLSGINLSASGLGNNLDLLKRNGLIFQPRPGYYQAVK